VCGELRIALRLGGERACLIDQTLEARVLDGARRLGIVLGEIRGANRQADRPRSYW